MKVRNEKFNQYGIALVLVLWMLVLLGLFAASYSRMVRGEIRITSHEVNEAKARALAEAGLWLGIHELLHPADPPAAAPGLVTKTVRIGKDEVTLTFQDESGRIDLNTARPEILYALLKTVDEDEGRRLARLHALLDWRDRDNLVRNQGHEDDEYRASGKDYQAKDGPFNHTSELMRVRGFDPVLVQRLLPMLTVHSHQPGIHPEHAPGSVLRAIPGISTDQIGAFRSRDADSAGFSGLDRKFINKVSGNTYTLYAVAGSGEVKTTLIVTVLLRKNNRVPYTVLSWQWANSLTASMATEPI